MKKLLWIIILVSSLIFTAGVNIHENGYILYCPCMGRFGNQADHFLGALGFAKGINRTLVLPHWVEYRFGEIKSIQVPFDIYFEVEPLLEYHDVVLMEDFMQNEAKEIWPPEKRISFCYVARGESGSCNAKEGNPFGPFWDTFEIDFVSSEFYEPLHYDVYHSKVAEQWREKYPPSKWPVLAFAGAPASFPVQKENKGLHKYLKWSATIDHLANNFIRESLPRGSFIGIHLRNGVDWVRACEHVPRSPVLFSSPQCFGYRAEYGPVTKEACFPTKDIIYKHIRRVMRGFSDVKSIYVASDNHHMLEELQETFKQLQIIRYPENNPHVDLAILGRSNHFIGNCVSSFSAFVKRERDASGFPSSFWAFPPEKKGSVYDEL
ncbi:hypothetical protein V9T40_004399 [Parthenolecanium corni]|uniref:GDP-fucose protein O-fucosyltransferase 1 n=1 Tax=Parthenolecanium corni TaxID=536013 RepID=A0AAN9TWB7_9HEMI